jgi:HTH-type transcriptional regulator, competence development regulator
MVNTGLIIKKLREKNNWSLRELEKRVGINYSVLSRIESGKRPVNDEELKRFADIFQVTTDYLLGRTDNPSHFREDNTEYNALSEINRLLKKYGIDQSGFFDIEKWKNMGPEEIKQLESYFEFIAEQAKKKNEENN